MSDSFHYLFVIEDEAALATQMAAASIHEEEYEDVYDFDEEPLDDISSLFHDTEVQTDGRVVRRNCIC